MNRFFRLYGKKRGERLSGWWLAGRAGEAFWFVAVCVLGVFSLSTFLAWEFLTPSSQAFHIGSGFWLRVLVSSSFIGIGAVGFIYRVINVAYSDEHRSVFAKRNLPVNKASLNRKLSMPPMVPSLQGFTDSPGVRLAFRLPVMRPETHALVLGSIFVLAWNALTIMLLVFAVSGIFSKRPDWSLLVVGLPLFLYVSFRVTRWFFVSFRRATGIGPTTIEINELPLAPGQCYQLNIVQYGRLAIKKLSIALVCEEVATYHFGTDTRTERQEVDRLAVFEQGRCRIDWGRPLELACQFVIPADAMHSFQSPHNAVIWKLIVEGEANRWPSYCRSFPVVVYPHGAKEPRLVVEKHQVMPS